MTFEPSPAIADYWQRYLATLPPDHPHQHAAYGAWGFGDSPAMMDELGALVVQGVKRATASCAWEYEAEEKPLPQVGEISIILDGREQPLCIIETTRIDIVPFDEVSEAFAATEGEGDGSLAYWHDAHWRFFSRDLPTFGLAPTQTMPIVCERFDVIFSDPPFAG